jgi:hypothetical protein
MKDLILGSHLLFAREGETIDGNVVSPTYKPDTDPEANYTRFPTVEAWEPKIARNMVTRRAPSPGQYQTRKKIQISSTITHAFSLQEFTETTLATRRPGRIKRSSMQGLRTGWKNQPFKTSVSSRRCETKVVADPNVNL